MSVLAVAAGIAGAMLLAATWLGAPRRDVALLAITLAGTGLGGIAASVLADRFARNLGLRARLVVFGLVGVGLLGVNVMVSAILMFISTHDLRMLVILFGFAIVATLGPAELMTQTIRVRLRALQEAAERMAGGDLAARAAPGGDDEVTAVAVAFNRMATEIEEANRRRDQVENARRELFAAMSHDLRTPLASLQAMAEAIQDGVVDDRATLDRYSAAIGSNVARLSALIDDLFELARIDSGDLRLDLGRLRVEEVVAMAIDAALPEARRAGLDVRFEPGETPPVLADAARLDRVLANLLQNAIRHTPGDGTIVLRTERAGADVCIAIADTGEGITPEDAEHVFERFFRVDRARRANTGGSGLGLSIARGIVEAHGGRIWLESWPGAGTRVTVSLPAAE